MKILSSILLISNLVVGPSTVTLFWLPDWQSDCSGQPAQVYASANLRDWRLVGASATHSLTLPKGPETFFRVGYPQAVYPPFCRQGDFVGMPPGPIQFVAHDPVPPSYASAILADMDGYVRRATYGRNWLVTSIQNDTDPNVCLCSRTSLTRVDYYMGYHAGCIFSGAWDYRTMMHETSHCLGRGLVGEGDSKDAAGNVTGYGDPYDLMGQNGTRSWNAFYSENMGVLSNTGCFPIVCVPPAGGDFVLTDIEATTPGIKAVKLPSLVKQIEWDRVLWGDNRIYFYLELRNGVYLGNNTYGPGVLVHEGELRYTAGSGSYSIKNSKLLTSVGSYGALKLGQQFTGTSTVVDYDIGPIPPAPPITNSVWTAAFTVTVTAISGVSATVHVNYH